MPDSSCAFFEVNALTAYLNTLVPKGEVKAWQKHDILSTILRSGWKGKYQLNNLFEPEKWLDKKLAKGENPRVAQILGTLRMRRKFLTEREFRETLKLKLESGLMVKQGDTTLTLPAIYIEMYLHQGKDLVYYHRNDYARGLLGWKGRDLSDMFPLSAFVFPGVEEAPGILERRY